MFSFLSLPFLLAVSSVVMSLKSRHMHQLWVLTSGPDSCPLTFILVPTSPWPSDWYRSQTPFSIPHTSSGCFIILPLLSGSKIHTAFSLSYQPTSGSPRVFGFKLQPEPDHFSLCLLLPPNNCLNAWSAKTAPLWWLCSCPCPSRIQQCSQSCAWSDVTSLLCSGLCKSQSPYLNHCHCEFSLRSLLLLYPIFTVEPSYSPDVCSSLRDSTLPASAILAPF